MSAFYPLPSTPDNAGDAMHPMSVKSPDGSDCKAERDEQARLRQQRLDLIDEAGMESFPCSDPPSYTRSHA